MPKLPSGQHVHRLQVFWRPVEADTLTTRMTDAIAASEQGIVGSIAMGHRRHRIRGD
jgi:hypothetical protein